jgi:AraC-like DNA-binding protein
MDQRIADIIGFIDENLDRHISPKEAARMAHLSYCQFAALFREETGKRFGEHLREKRIARAQSLFRNPGREIKEISSLAGYRSIHGFYHDFKKITGRTPGQFKKQPKS